MKQRGGSRAKKGQISVEHLFILMLSLGILIPGTTLFYTFSKNSNHQMVSNQIVRIGDEINQNAETVYYLGSGSRMRITLSLPRTMTSLQLKNNELIINYTSYSGKNEAVFFTDVPLTTPTGEEDLMGDNFHTGAVRFILENKNDIVEIRLPDASQGEY
jgi:hypothetical protein